MYYVKTPNDMGYMVVIEKATMFKVVEVNLKYTVMAKMPGEDDYISIETLTQSDIAEACHWHMNSKYEDKSKLFQAMIETIRRSSDKDMFLRNLGDIIGESY